MIPVSLRSPKLTEKPEKPLRGEILSRDAIAERAIELAERYQIAAKKIRSVKLQQRFKENTRILNGAYFLFAKASRDKEVLTAGAEWLLDNYHVVDEQVRDIRRDLPKSYYKALPKLSDSEWRGYPRIYHLICDFIAHTDATIETDLLTVFFKAYQTRSILRIGEVWAAPIMLRLALVENLRRLAQASLITREHRLEAERFCQQTIDIGGGAAAEMLIALVNGVNQNPAILDHAAAYILRRLRSKGSSAALCLQWLDEKLKEKGLDAAEITRQEQQSQAADQISFGNSVTALKTISSLNWREWFERVSVVDQILGQDPARIYKASDFITRDVYRHKLENLARRAKLPEVDVAEDLVDFAAQYQPPQVCAGEADLRYRHVGYYLADQGYSDIEKALRIKPNAWSMAASFIRRHAFVIYTGAIAALILFGLLVALSYGIRSGAGLGWALLAAVLFFVPLSEWSIQVVQWFVTKLTAPLPLPKLDFEDGVPENCRTLVAVQAIVHDKETIDRLVEFLEIRAIGNEDGNIGFGILADPADAAGEVLSGDRGIVNHAACLINELNDRYCREGPKRFFVMFRRRLWNAQEGKFMAWERKRGKIMEFNRLLRGADDTTFETIIGDLAWLKAARYVITLDTDTQLPPGVAKKLIGAIAHPLNKPVFDESKRIVVQGYGVIQPRVGITLQSGNASLFAQTFSGHSGLDPYTRTVSDVYQDLFREGSYIGKGIYNIDAFERSLDGRVPDNSLLSHDLFEGLFARCALASDIELFDEYPARYHSNSRRQHRWIRGDWQLVPWLFPAVPQAKGGKGPSPISGLGRWKLLDNLRRSLYPPALFLSFLLIWLGASGWWLNWLIGVSVVVAFPIYGLLLSSLLDIQLGYSLSSFVAGVWREVKKNTRIVFLNLVLLPHQALIAVHAVVLTLYRVYISRKRLLEWETAHAAERRFSAAFSSFFREMAPALILPLAGAAAIGWLGAAQWHWAAPLVGLWFLCPVIAWCISRPTSSSKGRVSQDDRKYLRAAAFATWKYFDSFLRPEYNYLIPDNLQIVPQRAVAERTSPTNISLSALSVISAYDLGFVALTGVVSRLANILGTLTKLERFHGHFLNWYEIRSLRALSPRYVSAVDSGNLVGHFIAVRQALKEFLHAPLITDRHLNYIPRFLEEEWGLSPEKVSELKNGALSNSNLASFISTINKLSLLRADLVSSGAVADMHRPLDELVQLEELIGWTKYLPLLKRLGEKEIVNKKLRNINRILEAKTPTLSLLLKLTNRLLKIDALLDREKLERAERNEFSAFIAELKKANDRLRGLVVTVNSAIDQVSTIINEVDFKFLVDSQKKLMVIGYNVDSGQRDNSFYDLFASESRLGSFVAICKGDLPQGHWFLLNRALTDALGGKALLSWSATMFEYLMPLLVMKDFPGTLLYETHAAVVRTQRLYARRRRVPWGMSESAYSGVDFEKTYQYRAFGVPGLGLKRGLGDDLVVSPYSTALALTVDPLEAVKNLRRLETYGLRGEFGFYESIDFTKERLSAEETSHVVKSFLAHHQGMSLIAINNFLNSGVFQERFHRDPAVKARELLLQERFPTKIPVIVPHQAEQSLREKGDTEAKAERSERIRSPHTAYPRLRLLSNGHYSVAIDNAGSGGSFLDGDWAITRWREDWLCNNSGYFIYIRDLKSRRFWSATYQPTRVEPDDYEVFFNPDKIEFKRRDMGISVHTEITVSPEDNVEVRRVTLHNTSARLRELEVTTFGEVALSIRKNDAAHPAFSKLFVESEYLEDYDALVFTRRQRFEGERQVFLAHMVTMPIVWAPIQFETMRDKFIGRGGTAGAPRAMQSGGALSRSVGTVLDPVFSLRTKVEINAGESRTVNFITIAAATRDELLRLIKRYREMHYIARAFEMAWSHSDVEIRNQQFSIKQVRAFERLATAIFYNIEELRAPAEMIKRNRQAQSALWRLGISGDGPIVLLALNDPEQVKLAQEMLLAHEYLRLRGVYFDLVILNEYPGGYMQDFQQELDMMIRSGYSREFVDKRNGVFLRALHHLSEEEVVLLYSAARVVAYGSKGSLASQIGLDLKIEPAVTRRKGVKRAAQGRFQPPYEPLEFPNSIGGFSDDAKSYTMTLRHDQLPPQPWVNIVSNRNFGFIVSESGAGFSWAENSRENRLSAWSNDPVTDPFSEVIYIRDYESGEYWAPTPRPVEHGELVKVKHAFGYSEFTTQVNQIFSKLVVSGAPEDRVKWWHVEVVNGDYRERKLELFLYFEWVLGVLREDSYRHLQTAFDPEAQILYCVNPFNIDFSGQVVFVGCSHTLHSYTSNRKEFIGRHGDVSSPLALEQANQPVSLAHPFGGGKPAAVKLSGKVGAGFDSCGALKVQVDLAPGERQHLLFCLGQANSLGQAKSLAARSRSLKTWSNSLEQVKRQWASVCGVVQVSTPQRSFDILVNGWLIYQTLSSRIMARTGFYQNSGALGFRDQLQDATALVYARPEDLRRQILLHASRQFVEGDVQHWWHPPSGRGIRTKISDNYLWLPYAVYHYVIATGDRSILDERISFLEAALLEAHEVESYMTPRKSQHEATLYQHCIIALDRALIFGAHGLPLIGSGDWNDGLNQVGVKGRGESVWLGWFVAGLLRNFAELIEEQRDFYRANEYRQKAREIVSAIESNAWDGGWYRRAYFDDGAPLGSAGNSECRIDSIAQSWSVISGLGDAERHKEALANVYKHLVRPEDKLICLLWPPFDRSSPSPGYIQGYPPGIRENGGQYTHAAAWLILATARQGQGGDALRLFGLINPIEHTSSDQGMLNYQTEPYVTCGDVYSVVPHTGRGGWSWYTGSSAWLYRVAVEELIGLKLHGSYFVVEPAVPADWREFHVEYRRAAVIYKIQILNPRGVESGVSTVTVDGAAVPDKKIAFFEAAEHGQVVNVEVLMG